MAPLRRENVIDAGVILVRHEGLEALGVRSVAGALGVTPMALYRHIRDGEDLRVAVVDRILGDLPAVPSRGSWKARYRNWAVGARHALSLYPGMGQHLLTGWFAIPVVLSTVEQLLGVAEQHGETGFRAVAEANAVFMYVLMRLIAEQSVRDAKVVRRELAIAGGVAHYPRLHENIRHYQVARMDEHFLYGLETLLAGLSTASTRHTTAKDSNTKDVP